LRGANAEKGRRLSSFTNAPQGMGPLLQFFHWPAFPAGRS
jgi:hypothetical protein